MLMMGALYLKGRRLILATFLDNSNGRLLTPHGKEHGELLDWDCASDGEVEGWLYDDIQVLKQTLEV